MNRIKIYRCADCQVPQKAAGATKATSEAPSSMFRDWQRTQTQSSATDLTDPEAANGCPVLRDAGTIAERHTRAIEVLEPHTCVLSRARPGILCFSLDIRLTWMAGFQLTLYGRIWVTPKGGWISDDTVWTAVEVLKSAEKWRVLRMEGTRTLNPIVGQACFPFPNPMSAIVSTSGVPYLTQGTAQPIIAQITNVRGNAKVESVLRDLVWQADMCFTKVDMGMSLPWVLHVADQGALQLSRSYRITGVTV